MDKLTCMRAFVKVVDAGSFAEAARRLAVSAPMVTKYVGYLERTVRARLLNRSPHSLSLTEAGQAYYERCVRLLEEIDEAEQAVGSLNAHPRGTLRMSVSSDFGTTHLGPAMLEFVSTHPDVRLDVSFSSRQVDLVEEGFDLAIRITDQLRTNLVARKLATSRLIACASPGYLAQHGRPQMPENLVHHTCLAYADEGIGEHWRFTRKGRVSRVRVTGSIRAGSNELLRLAALAGHGILLQPSFNVCSDLGAGRLVQVLQEYDTDELGIYAVYPHRKFLAAKVRGFIDSLVGRFGEDSNEDGFWPAGRVQRSVDGGR